jgi:phosphoserine phosphatase
VEALILLFVAVAVARAAALARGYGRPIEALVKDSDRIGAGDLEPGEVVQSSLVEVQQLASAHDRMRQGLRKLLKVEQELQVARMIQQGTFPARLPSLEGYEIVAWSEPADETGGDTYDVIGVRRTDDGQIELTADEAERVVFLLADATGHGIGPALSVTQARAMLRMAVRLSAGPAEMVRNINEQLTADLPSNRFITAWLAVLDPDRNTLTGLSAAQAPLLHYHHADDSCEVLDADTLPLGVFVGLEVEIPAPRALEPGDIFAVMSDGIFEALAPDGEEEFGIDRTVALIRRYRSASLDDLLAGLRAAVNRFTDGAPAHDDRTVILCRRSLIP